jgi:hypothetical protein
MIDAEVNIFVNFSDIPKRGDWKNRKLGELQVLPPDQRGTDLRTGFKNFSCVVYVDSSLSRKMLSDCDVKIDL